MLNYKRLVPRTLSASVYAHNNEKLTDGEADKINDGSFIEDATSVNGECVTSQEVNQKLSQENKHVNYMVGGDDVNELVCYYTWSSDTIEPTSVYIPDLSMTVEDRKLLAYEITPSNADVTSAEFSITSGSDIAHIDGSYVVADAEGSATYKVVINGSIEATATITVSNKPEEFPDDSEHRWIEVEPKNSTIPADGGTITVTGSYGLTGTYGTKKKVGDISDTITIEANSETTAKSGSKTYYYNNNQFDAPTAEVKWTQETHVEQFTYTYDIKIGLTASDVTNDVVSVVFSSDEYGSNNQKQVYVKAIKNKVNESGTIVSSEEVDTETNEINFDTFKIVKDPGVYHVYPNAANSSVSNRVTETFQIRIKESQQKYCTVTLIQERNGIKVVSGDAVMFTYNWTTGKDLDQATYVITNTQYDESENYAGYSGVINGPQRKFLYFAGDNTGLGNEYSFIDFKSVAEWLEENGDQPSTVSGKTILESHTDENGIISIECDLYTVWYNTKDGEDITLSYTVYDKTSKDASVTSNSDDKTFKLTGYTQRGQTSSSPALCYAKGSRLHFVGPNSTYTLSAKFTYYLNSGVFVFETNDGNVDKWQQGVEYQQKMIDATIDTPLISEDDENITFSAIIKNFNLLNSVSSSITGNIQLCVVSGLRLISNTNNLFTYRSSFGLPFTVNNTVSKSVIRQSLGSGTYEICIAIDIDSIYDDENYIQYSYYNKYLTDNKLTITV